MGLKAEAYCGDTGFENYIVLNKKSLNFFDALKNSNKFYTLEIHECGGNYRIFTDYGRVGVSSKPEVRNCSSRYEAENEFEKIAKSKIKKGYVEVELAKSNTGSDEGKKLIDLNHVKVEKKVKTVSKLHKDVQKFVNQIFDEAGAKLNNLIKGNSDAKGSPLGQLSSNQISKGRKVLQEISNLLNLGKNDTHAIEQLSNEFYRHIPRAFGRRVSISDVLIKTLDKVSEQMDILKFYEDSLKMGDVIYNNDIDKQFDSLKCEIGVLSSSTKEYKDLVHYVNSTESRHHGVTLQVKRIFTLTQNNAPKFDDKVGNKKLLFHGTRSANLPAILSTHLKLPNQLKGVHITGAMFGPGIYFADQSTKSSQYACSKFGGTVNKYNSAFLLVSEVALGKVKEVENATYYYDAPNGYNSVKGVMGRSLLHNEYIIYKENQHQLKYIIEFEPKRKY